MKSILTVIGARPQFIKAAAVSRVFRANSDIRETLLHTGQHYDENMSDIFFRQLDIPAPAINLNVGSESHGKQTAQMLEGIEATLLKTKPDALLVYGDTNSTLAGALAAAKLHIPIMHVEAGLRSFNKRMPEEINRILTDHCASLLFTPTPTAIKNLVAEGISPDIIHDVGDVMYDSALHFGRASEGDSALITRHGLKSGQFVLATIHRAENTDVAERLSAIIEGLGQVNKKFPVVLPIHPRTRKLLSAIPALAATVASLRIIEPVGYLDMIQLEKHAAVIATDSGGVQKEAFFCGVPCVTLRDESEWVELVESGWNKLVAPKSAAAVRQAILESVGTKGRPIDAYGKGDSAQKIVAVIKRYLGS